MKVLVLALGALLASAASADTLYCKLENVPAVKTALNQALADVDAATAGANVAGITQVTVKAMGDAFDYWGTDLLIYRLDNIANDNAVAVGVKVQYNSVMAKELKASDPAGPDYVCQDTGEVNPELVYIDGEKANGENITAVPVKF